MAMQLPMSDGLFISPHRPKRDKIANFVRACPYIVEYLVTLIIVFSIWDTVSIWWVILPISIYWVYVASKMIFRQSKSWGKYYSSLWLSHHQHLSQSDFDINHKPIRKIVTIFQESVHLDYI